jgi:hypothetical protein
MGNTDFDRKPDQHGSQNTPGQGQGAKKPTSDQDSERRNAHSLPGTNQAGKGPGADDEHDQQTNPPGGTGEAASHHGKP